jgi:apolipoprotein N-acyltransferase
MFTRTVLSAAIEARSERTFYAQHGDVFAQGCLMTSGLLLAAALGQKLRVFIRTRSEIA